MCRVLRDGSAGPLHANAPKVRTLRSARSSTPPWQTTPRTQPVPDRSHRDREVNGEAYCNRRGGVAAGPTPCRLVNPLHGTLSVEQHEHQLRNGELVLGPPKSAAGRRTIALPPFLVPESETHLAAFAAPGPEGRVFPGEKGGPFRRHVVQKHWARARATVDLPAGFRIHDLRHTANTLTAATGASTRDLMFRMGRASAQPALRYQHATRQRDTEMPGRSGSWSRQLSSSTAWASARRGRSRRNRISEGSRRCPAVRSAPKSVSPAGVDEDLRQPGRQVLVDQKPHGVEVSGSVRSRRASAAKCRASWMSSGSRSGKSARISSTVIPSATMATTVATGTAGHGCRDPARLGGIDAYAVERHRASVSAGGRESEWIRSAGSVRGMGAGWNPGAGLRTRNRGSKRPADDQGKHGGAGDENRTRVLSLGSSPEGCADQRFHAFAQVRVSVAYQPVPARDPESRSVRSR